MLNQKISPTLNTNWAKKGIPKNIANTIISINLSSFVKFFFENSLYKLNTKPNQKDHYQTLYPCVGKELCENFHDKKYLIN